MYLAIKGVCKNPIPKSTKGLIHVEYMTAMTLGSPILSTQRILLREVAVFVQWENEQSLDDFLSNNKFGKKLTNGWHVRMRFMRVWGQYQGIHLPSEKATLVNENDAVVAVTLARMKPLQVPRFLRWGKPVERLVRDHPGTTLSLATYRFPNVISTFSIWKNQDEMVQMVQGHSNVPKPKRHAKAMKERNRKNFHFEFITLRFKPIATYGSWKGKSNFIHQFENNKTQ